MIKINSLSKSFGSFLVLDNISVEIKDGEFISILGTFGCGKTTLMKIIGGLIKDYSGEIKINNTTPSQILKKRKIGFCFQKSNLLPWRNVVDNISLPLNLKGNYKNTKKAISLLKLIGLESIAHKKIWEISGGTQQLVSILRSLVLDPNILLLDEPFSSVDEISRDHLHCQLIKMHKKTRKTIIMITHSINEAVFLSDRIFILSKNPARIKETINVNLQTRDEATKKSSKYISYVNKCRLCLKG